MDEEIDSLIVEVRASTEGFTRDIEGMRGTVDSTLVDGFSRAGNVLERGLVGAIRRGSLGFDDLKRIALNTINEIAAQAARNLFASLPGGGLGGLFNLGSVVGSVLGLPGRATGGPVSPGRGYLVGERGPELFVPTSSGRVQAIESPGGSRSANAGRNVNVTISVLAPPSATVPQSLQRSNRQIASAVRRALAFG